MQILTDAEGTPPSGHALRFDAFSFVRRYATVLEWVAFLAIFLITGTIGHDPWWKRGETYTFGIIYHFYATHIWLVPVDAGTPFMEKPPLYFWSARLMGDLFSLILPLHDAVRLVSVVYTPSPRFLYG